MTGVETIIMTYSYYQTTQGRFSYFKQNVHVKYQYTLITVAPTANIYAGNGKLSTKKSQCKGGPTRGTVDMNY